MTAVPELFRHFPALRTKLPWTALARPTPVDMLGGPRFLGSSGRIWIKRDDKTNDVYGGHEARELEFVFGDALRRGARRLLAFGHVSGARSLALVTLARAFELEVVLALAGRPEDPRAHWLLEQELRLGAVVHPLHRGPLEFLRLLRTCLTPRAKRGRPRFPVALWPRRAALLQTLGAMNGVFELQRQIRCGILPEPSCIYVGTDSLPTLAGLAAGCELAGLRSRLVATGPGLARPARELAHRALQTLQRQVPGLPRMALRCDRVEWRPAPRLDAVPPLGALSSMAPGFEPGTAASLQAMGALLSDRKRRESRGPQLLWHAEAPQPRRSAQPSETSRRTTPAHA